MFKQRLHMDYYKRLERKFNPYYVSTISIGFKEVKAYEREELKVEQ